MENMKRILREQEFRTKGRFFRDAVCNVRISINEDSGMHEVLLMEPDAENYSGVSVSNYFEVFATRIKDQFLPDVNPDKIHWFNHIKLMNPEFEYRTFKLELDWKDGQCTNAQWKGAEALSV